MRHDSHRNENTLRWPSWAQCIPLRDAAFEEYSRNGYAAATLDQVAERAGVTKGTIYVYFESKEHLFISMVRELVKMTFGTVQDMFASHDGSTADLLRESFRYV